MLRDERLENLFLLQLIGVFRTAPDHIDVSERGSFAFGSDFRVVENREIERLRNHGESKAPGRSPSRRCSPRRRTHDTRERAMAIATSVMFDAFRPSLITCAGAPPPARTYADARPRIHMSSGSHGRRRCSLRMRSPPPALPVLLPYPAPLQRLIHDDDHDDDESDDESIVKSRARDLRQRVAEHAEDKRPDTAPMTEPRPPARLAPPTTATR